MNRWRRVLSAETVEVWYAGQKVEQLPRLRGRGKHRVDYRHIIDWLVRKPGAFENYRYREELFPTSRFRMAWDALREVVPLRANKRYLEILQLAAQEGEARVDEALRGVLEEGEIGEGKLNVDAIRLILAQQTHVLPVTQVAVAEVALTIFDELLGGNTTGRDAMNNASDVKQDLNKYLRELQLSAIRRCFEEKARQAERETLGYEHYLLELAERECQERRSNRITRLLQASKLPLEKTMDTFELKRLPVKAARQVKALLDGTFLDRRENVLAFGNPGSGKTHLLSALGQELIRQGRRVAFSTCVRLVQDLLRAKKDLQLSRAIKKLAYYEALVIDDIGYVQQSREEMEVLFTLLAERYERGSVLITSNLPFSKWEAIFKDPMTTASAIDRLVHHSVILELNIASYRMEQAKQRKTEHE